jgi:hypothetical protein
MPPAPAWFSTTKRWPSLSLSFSATMRAVMSATPPAAKGSTIRIGFSGYFACAAGKASSDKPARVRARKGRAVNFISFL